MADGDIDGALAVVEINCIDEDDFPDSATYFNGVLSQLKKEYTDAVRQGNEAQLNLLFDADFAQIKSELARFEKKLDAKNIVTKILKGTGLQKL